VVDTTENLYQSSWGYNRVVHILTLLLEAIWSIFQ